MNIVEYIYIGIKDKADRLEELIRSSLTEFKTNDVNIEIEQKEEKNDKDLSFLKITIRTKNKVNKVRINLSNILSDYIIEEYEEKFINKIINTNYYYFDSFEKKEILRLLLDKILNLNEKNVFNNIFILSRKNIIAKKLNEYLSGSDKIILDGFITFRLKGYIKELEDIVDKAVDDYLMEREYREFIRLLKYFVEIQEPKFELVHVLIGYKHKYILLDEHKNEITNDCIQDFIKEVSEGEINYDDLLVSSLITLAPKKICLHMVEKMKNKELLETIKSVFYGKVNFCEGCNLCLVKNAEIGRKVYK